MATDYIIRQPQPLDVPPKADKPPIVRFVPIDVRPMVMYGVVGTCESRPAARPQEVLVGTLGDTGYGTMRLLKAIPARVEFRGDGIIVSWDEIDEFGTGGNLSAAIQDLGRTLSELYLSLSSEKGNLGPEMERIWRVLQQFMAPR